MKKIITQFGCLVLCGLEVFAANKEININNSFEDIKGDAPLVWKVNSIDSQRLGTLEIISHAAQEGNKCIKIKTQAGQLLQLFAIPMTDVSPSDTIRLSAYVKGTGSFKIAVYLYNNDKCYLATAAPQAIKVANTEWTKADFEIKLSGEEFPERADGQVAHIRPAIVVDANSELCIDNFSSQIESLDAKEERISPVLTEPIGAPPISEAQALVAHGPGWPLADWSKMRKFRSASSASITAENGIPILSFTYDEKAGKAGFIDTPFHVPEGCKAEGVAFEARCDGVIRNDGAPNYASIFFGYPELNEVTEGYEAIFPLDSTDWKKVTLRWDLFAQNYLPFGEKTTGNHTTQSIDPAQITLIGFGISYYMHAHYPTHAVTFQIRNISLVDHLSTPKANSFSQGFSHTNVLLAQKRPLNILLLGDSITEMGGKQSYAYYLGKKIKQFWGNDCEIANCGVGGHSVRGGMIILPRSLRTMPNPDVVFILYGANDCKAVEKKPGFNEQTFRMDLENLIDRVRIATGGNADICLINGVPRLGAQSLESSGDVERIVDGHKGAATNKKTAFVDTFGAYLQLPSEQRKHYYLDTVHQNQLGLEYIGNKVFETLRAAIDSPES
jgi:lysophospholipase L1-like esterase